MRTFLTLSLCVFSLSALAGHKESHGNREDELKCSKEIRALDCGDGSQPDAFIQCVNGKLSSLSTTCQDFFKDDLDRAKDL